MSLVRGLVSVCIVLKHTCCKDYRHDFIIVILLLLYLLTFLFISLPPILLIFGLRKSYVASLPPLLLSS